MPTFFSAMKPSLAFFRLDGHAKKTFKILSTLSFFYVFPLIWADYYSTDDWRRSIAGFASWEWDGRPLTSWMMASLSFGAPLLDIFPIPLLLGLAMLCYSLVLLGRRYFVDYAPLYTACALFLFIANPFFLENLSYKYDSLSMCIALASIILVFSLDDAVHPAKLFVISTICILVTLNIYQPALCAFFCFLLIKILFDIINARKLKDIFSTSVYLLSSCALSLVLYKFTTVSYYFHRKIPDEFWNAAVMGYAKMHSSVVGIDSISLIYANIKNFMLLVDSLLQSIPAFLVYSSVLLVTIFTMTVIFNFLFKNNYRLSLSGRIMVSLCILLLPAFIFVNTFLFLTILKSPIFNCRVMLSFGCVMLLIGISIYYISKKVKIFNLFFIPFFAFIFIFIGAYGNVIKNQKNYDIVLMQKMSYDIERIEEIQKNKHNLFMSFVGEPPISKQLALASSRFPIIKRLLYRYFSEEWPFITYILPNYIKQDSIMSMPLAPGDVEYMQNSPPYIKNNLYSIYINNNKIIVRFHNT